MLAPINVYAAYQVKAETQISGVENKMSVPFREELSLSVSISPSNGGRRVYLQRYSSERQKYFTVSRYTTPDASNARLRITVPSEKRKCTTSIWRIYVDESDKAKKADFAFRVTTSNFTNPKLNSLAACIYCVDDDTVIFDRNCHERRSQASITKLMTASLLIDSGKLHRSTVVTEEAASTPYGYIDMIVGDRFTNKSLLYAIMLPSSNSAAVLIAKSVSGSTSKFVKKMNARAKQLGLKDTHFMTPYGLDEKGHYSSAYDISIIMADIYSRSRTFRRVIATKSYYFKTKNYKIETLLETRDDYLKDYTKRHKGGKTGHTTNAGYCFCGVYEYRGKTYVVTVMGAPELEQRWDDMKVLYRYIDKYAATKY